MKIAYVNYLLNPDSLQGVFNKIKDQALTCQTSGLPIHFYIITASPIPKPIQNITFISIPSSFSLLRQYFIVKAIRHHCQAYDCVILREPRYTPFLLMLKNKPFKLIFEHHSKKFVELLTEKNYLSYFLQRCSYKLIQRVCDIKITVTKEIADYERSLGFTPSKPIYVVSNGIATTQEPTPVGFNPFDGITLSLIFVASKLYPWHGLDRVIQGINQFNGTVKFTLHLVGDIDLTLINLQDPQHRIIHHGIIQNPDQLDPLYRQCSLAISSLALYKNKLQDACVLKTREYTLKGIPFIYAYHDSDIPNPQPFCYQFSNGPDPINMSEVIQFATRSSCDPISLSKQSTQYAIDHMSWQTKMTDIVSFCKT